MPSLSDIRAIHDQPLPELVKAAASVHRGRWEASRARPKGSSQIVVGACDLGCERCGPPPPPAQREVAEVMTAAGAARESGQKRFCLSSPGRDASYESTLDLVRRIRSLGLEVCIDHDLADPEEARKLKEAGCSILCHHPRAVRSTGPVSAGPCFSQRELQGFQAALEAGLQVCFSCLLGQEDTKEDRLCFLQVLANGAARPDIMHVRLRASFSDEVPLPPSEVIRFIATARILLPGCRLHLAMERSRLDHRSLMTAHLCGANTIDYLPRRKDWAGEGSYADHTYLPTRWEA